jgi:hypothetical protein
MGGHADHFEPPPSPSSALSFDHHPLTTMQSLPLENLERDEHAAPSSVPPVTQSLRSFRPRKVPRLVLVSFCSSSFLSFSLFLPLRLRPPSLALSLYPTPRCLV